MELLEKVKINLRTKTTAFDEAEVSPLIEAAKKELLEVGVLNIDDKDPLILRAIVTYCKAHFGYDNKDSEKFIASFNSQKNFLSQNSNYTRKKDGGGDG